MIRSYIIALAGLVTFGLASGAEEVNVSTLPQHSLKALTQQSQVQLIPIKSTSLSPDKTLIKLRETYQNIPVFNYTVVASKKSHQPTKHQGTILTKLSKDLATQTIQLSKSDVLRVLKEHVKSMPKSKIRNPMATLYIFKTNDNKAHFAYYTSFMIDGQNPTRPSAFIDASNGHILHQWDALTTDRFNKNASGPGGNIKVGIYTYSKAVPAMTISKDCKMSAPYNYTLDMKNKTSNGNIFKFSSCPEKRASNTYKLTNDAYSPLNDVHVFSEQTANMFYQWYQVTPYDERIKARVHYGQQYANAFWDGEEVTFGDGNDNFYPFSSPDVVAHEIAHAFTEQSSNLVNENQSGAINESYSDISGEALKYFLNIQDKYPQWLHGEGVSKSARGTAIRYFEDPTMDGLSINHTDNYKDGMDPHYSAGIFNHAFYLLATKPNWNIRKAYDAFTLANQIFWKPLSTFSQGACDIKRSAHELNLQEEDVIDAFAEVGVDASCQEKPDGDDLPILSRQTKKGLHGFKGNKIFYFIDIKSTAKSLRLSTKNGQGDVDLYVGYNMHPALNHYNCQSAHDGNIEQCLFFNVKPGRYYIMLYAYDDFNDVMLSALTT